MEWARGSFASLNSRLESNEEDEKHKLGRTTGGENLLEAVHGSGEGVGALEEGLDRVSQTILKLTCWVCGTNPSTLGEKNGKTSWR